MYNSCMNNGLYSIQCIYIHLLSKNVKYFTYIHICAYIQTHIHTHTHELYNIYKLKVEHACTTDFHDIINILHNIKTINLRIHSQREIFILNIANIMTFKPAINVIIYIYIYMRV